MSQKGRYCKAYPLSMLRQYSGLTENKQNIRKEKRDVDGKEEEVQRELTDSDFLYLQENFTLTDDIFIDENIIFADVTPEWIDFCKNTLKFEIPVYESVAPQKTQESANALAP
jgi:hypothetical protein